MSETVTRSGLAIGALGVGYEIELFPGKSMRFETAIDATMLRDEIDQLLDNFIGAAKRQAAIEELPVIIENQYVNRKKLEDLERMRAQIIANARAREQLRLVDRPRGTPSKNRPPRPVAEDGDIGNLASLNKDIADVKSRIYSADARIPYLRALIAGEIDFTAPQPMPVAVMPERVYDPKGEDEEGAASAA